jgi:hypothetical protein
MKSFQDNDSDASLDKKLREASWEAFKTAMHPYVLPSVGPATLLKAYNELSEAYKDDREPDTEELLKIFDRAFNPTLIRDLWKFRPTAPTLTEWGTEVDPKWHTLLAMTTGMKLQNIHIPSKVGFALSAQYRDKAANSTEFNRFVGNRQNFIGPNYRENIVQKYKEFIAKEKEIARRVKTIFEHGQTLGLGKAELVDLATTFDKRIKVGEDRWKASFGKKYIAQINDKEYPLSFVSEEILQKIRNTLRDKGEPLQGDSLITDLLNVIRQENKDRIGD